MCVLDRVQCPLVLPNYEEFVCAVWGICAPKIDKICAQFAQKHSMGINLRSQNFKTVDGPGRVQWFDKIVRQT